MATEVKLPEVGENVAKATIVRVLVKAGDEIKKDQSILEIETDKATLEVPSNVGGRVSSVNVKDGQEVKVGQVILTVDSNGAAPAAEPKKEETKPGAARPEAQKSKADQSIAESPAKLSATAPESKPEPTPAPSSPAPQSAAKTTPPTTPLAEGETVPASPSVRRFAREIGIDIRQIQGTGPGGRISTDDVKLFAKNRAAQPAAAAPGMPAAPPLPDFAQWGEIERHPLSGIRKVIGERLSYSWMTIPHVHQYDLADITDLEAQRKAFNERAAKTKSPKLTMTAILMKLLVPLLKKYPQFNSTLDSARGELVLKKYIHIGIAVDTERGLVVPVIRDVDKKSVVQLAAELDQISEKARAGKLTLEEMRGGTFTISNLGGIGGTSFDPIINSPEVSILGVARARNEVALQDGKPVERLMLPVCVAYDHRVIDGADGARFTAALCASLSNLFQFLVEI